MEYTNVRELLDMLGFDWATGRIVYQATTGYSPGCSDGKDIAAGIEIGTQHPILDEQFYAGYGSAWCPRIIARDNEAIYIPVQYDGASWMTRIVVDLDWYKETGHPTPYPGGG